MAVDLGGTVAAECGRRVMEVEHGLVVDGLGRDGDGSPIEVGRQIPQLRLEVRDSGLDLRIR